MGLWRRRRVRVRPTPRWSANRPPQRHRSPRAVTHRRYIDLDQYCLVGAGGEGHRNPEAVRAHQQEARRNLPEQGRRTHADRGRSQKKNDFFHTVDAAVVLTGDKSAVSTVTIALGEDSEEITRTITYDAAKPTAGVSWPSWASRARSTP